MYFRVYLNPLPERFFHLRYIQKIWYIIILLDNVYARSGLEQTLWVDQSCLEFTLVCTFEQMLSEVPATPLPEYWGNIRNQNRIQKKTFHEIYINRAGVQTCRLHEALYLSSLIYTHPDLTGCYGFCYYLELSQERKLAQNLADQCKRNPYHDQYW